jgi:hypothetical protein
MTPRPSAKATVPSLPPKISISAYRRTSIRSKVSSYFSDAVSIPRQLSEKSFVPETLQGTSRTNSSARTERIVPLSFA